MAQLTKTRFDRYKTAFRETVLNTPKEVKIFMQHFFPVENDDYQAMIKSRRERYEVKTVKCLYERNITDKQRQKYGLSNDITGLVYIAPDDLIAAFGKFQLPHKKLLVEFIDLEDNFYYEVDRIVYEEPLFNSCIAVRLHVRNTTRKVDSGDIIVTEAPVKKTTYFPLEFTVGDELATSWGFVDGANVVVNSVFTDIDFWIIKNGYDLPKGDQGDGSNYFTKETAGSTIQFFPAIVSGDKIKITEV